MAPYLRTHVNAKRYAYKKLCFCSYFPPLQLSVAKILADFGMHSRITRHDIRLDSVADMKKHFMIIGSNNPKHLKRYRDSSIIRNTGRVRRMVSQQIANL